MNKPKARMTPEELFTDVLTCEGASLTTGGLHLLVSGLNALRATPEKPLNPIELKALSGMIAYVAFTQDVSEEIVLAVLGAHFDVGDVKAIPSHLYDAAMDFLMHVEMTKILN